MKMINELSYAQRERLIFIDLCLSYLGEISRAELIDKFQTGLAAATRDFATYKEFAPANMELIHKSKTYHRTDDFKPLFKHETKKVLHELSSGFGLSFPNQLSQACVNSVSLVNPPENLVSTVMRAIVKNKALKCEYVSLTSGVKQRVIIPHSFINNGKRWHVRAYDRDTQVFKDFVITRFKQLQIIDSDIVIAEMKESDNQWNRIVDLTLIPHPKSPFPEAIELDYAMTDGQLHIEVRAALVGYMLNQWNVDCSESYQLNHKQYQLALKVREAVYAVHNAYLAPGYQEIEQ
ncbi:MAG: hypothetical protein ACJAS1_005786 [Oleiphilaceae bacterium]|jgi:hypothetical protein